uniref:Uncharacterized protein n=1 Tax=Panagrolaimus sp. JU765 TaxID=591449 RepID=A0AC34RQ22_9BILA
MDDSPSVDLSLFGTVEVVEAQTSPPTSPGEHIQVGDDDDDEDRYRGKPRPIPIWLIVFVVAGLALCVAGFITFGACFIWHYVRSSKREAIRAAKKNQKSEIGKELKQKKEQAEEKIQDEVFEQSSINIREAKAKAEEKDKKTGDLKEEMQQELNRDKKLN